MSLMGALPAWSPFSSIHSYRLVPTQICSGLSKLDVVKNSELELLMYVISIIKFIKTFIFFQRLAGEDRSELQESLTVQVSNHHA